MGQSFEQLEDEDTHIVPDSGFEDADLGPFQEFENPADATFEPVTEEDAFAVERPDYLPEKFWDAERGEPRLESLAQSYLGLERRLGGIPGAVEDYRITPSFEAIEVDPDVNARLHEAGFTQSQAQLVYDLAAEKLVPMVQDLAAETLAMEETRKLADHFGGDEPWSQVSRQLANWGQANLSEEVYAALSSSYRGVLAMHQLMADGEPALVNGGVSLSGVNSEDDLIGLMNDPRYWREHDPAVVSQVADGFRRLYPAEDE